MSTDNSSSNGISQQVAGIEEKASQAEEIKQRIEREEEERKRAKRKNRAFRKLKSTIEEIDSERERLADWVDLARAMNVECDVERIQATLNQVERRLAEFTETSYQDFEDAAAINDLREDTFETLRTDIQQHANTVQDGVEQAAASKEEQIRRAKTALRIPDLGESGDTEQLEEIIQFLTTIQQGELPRNGAAQWEQLEAKYEEIELSLEGVQSRYELSDETINVIRRFLDDETVMLSELDSEVLTELQTFEEFNERLAIRFKEES